MWRIPSAHPPGGPPERWKPRAAALLLAGLFVLSAGCMAMESGKDVNNNNQSWPDGTTACSYAISVTPFSPRVGEVVELEVGWTGNCVPRPTGAYEWTLTGPDQQPVSFTSRQGGRIVEIVPSLAGSYQVRVAVDDLTEGIVNIQRSVTVVDPTGMQQTYLLRLTPPLDSGAPRQQRVIVVTGGTPITGRVVTLDEGVIVQNQVQGPDGPCPAYVRFTETGFPLFRELHSSSTGQFSMPVLPSSLYDVMVVPDGSQPAPAQLLGKDVTSLLQGETFRLDAGVVVVGYVEDHQGIGVGQAQAALRSGDLTSSVALTDAFDGRFVLWARPGVQGLEIVPREGLSLPRVRLPDSTGISLSPEGGLGLRLRYRAVPTAQLTIRVTAGPDGSPEPVSAARVTLEATDLGVVASLQVTQDGTEVADLEAPGSYQVTGLTDATGALSPLTLPAGTYRVVIEAPAGVPGGFGTTVLGSVEVEAGASDLALVLALPGALEGLVVDDLLAPVEGVRVVAFTRIGVGSATETTTDADGFFSLDVIRGASYSLRFMPPSGRQLARRVVEGVSVGTDDITWFDGPGPGGEVILTRGLDLVGRVVFQADGLSGVLVQAIPSGLAGDPVLAEAVTGPDGDFSLVVPDPGFVE